MTMSPGNALVTSKEGALDIAHFKGGLLRSISEFERADVITVNYSGARAGEEIFLRSKYRSWADHPAFGPMLTGLGEKGTALSDALAASRGFRFLNSGSDRLFTSLAAPSGGRNAPSYAKKSIGLFDVNHFTVAGVSPVLSNNVYSYVKPVSDALVKLQYTNVYALHKRLEKYVLEPAANLVSIAAWASADATQRATWTSQGKRVATVAEDDHITWFGKHVTRVADRTAALAVTTTALALITGQPRARLVRYYVSGTAAQGGLPADEFMWLSVIANCHVETATVELDKRAYTSMFLDKAMVELAAKGLQPTGFVRVVASQPFTMTTATYTFTTGVATTPYTVNVNNGLVSRNGTTSLVYEMWNASFVFELVGEHPNDVLWLGYRYVAGVTDVVSERITVGFNSYFAGGVSATPQNTQAQLDWYLSSLAEPWHPGAPDPFAAVDKAAIVMDNEQTATGNLGHRLTTSSVRSLKALGTPRFYLPLFAPLGSVDILYRVPSLEISEYEVIAHHDVVIDNAISIGRVSIDKVTPTVDQDPTMFDPEEVDPGSFDPSDPAQVSRLVGGAAVITASINMQCDRYCGSADGSWLQSTAFSGFGLFKPVSDKEKAAITSFLPQLNGKSVAFACYAKPVVFRSKIVQDMDVYRQYKKSREKACKLNNFLSTKYHGKVTWGQAQNEVTKARSSTALYGLYEPPSLVDEAAVVDYTKVTYTYVVGSAPAQLKRTQTGTADAVFTVDQADAVFNELARGAVLSGITLVTLSSSWNSGTATATIVTDLEEMKAAVTSLSSKSDGARATTGGASLVWSSNSYNVNGYPLVEQLLYQDALKAILNSVNLYTPVGAVFKAAMERTGEGLIAASVVRGKRHIENATDKAALFNAPVQ